MDGVLDDGVWTAAPLDLPEWLSYNPVSGQKIAQRTEVRVAYDPAALYVAFRCLDPEPDRVRATLSRRDQLFSDDWVGLSLDAVGNRQQSYDLFVNPLGVQADILNTATAGENLSPDWVWESAGRTTPEGYEVEIRVPWKNIRFASGMCSATCRGRSRSRSSRARRTPATRSGCLPPPSGTPRTIPRSG